MYSPRNNITCPYENYYAHQAGSGIGVVYKGAPYQRGHGIGSFLGGLFRSVLPLLSSGAKTVGKEALSAGVGLLSDMVNARPMEDSIKSRLKEVGANLKRKADDRINRINMSGSGYITKRKLASTLSPSLTVKVDAIKKKSKNKRKLSKQIKDIFSI